MGWAILTGYILMTLLTGRLLRKFGDSTFEDDDVATLAFIGLLSLLWFIFLPLWLIGKLSGKSE